MSLFERSDPILHEVNASGNGCVFDCCSLLTFYSHLHVTVLTLQFVILFDQFLNPNLCMA